MIVVDYLCSATFRPAIVSVPQRLKPLFSADCYGTAEAVPLSMTDRALRDCPTHAMKPHEWGTRLVLNDSPNMQTGCDGRYQESWRNTVKAKKHAIEVPLLVDRYPTPPEPLAD
jgi:hypothetical protein